MDKQTSALLGFFGGLALFGVLAFTGYKVQNALDTWEV